MPIQRPFPVFDNRSGVRPIDTSFYTVQYGALRLQVCHFNQWVERPVYSEDGCDYLYTHFLIDVECYFNVAATSIPFIGTDQDRFDAVRARLPNELERFSWSPAMTIRYIREYLKTPRRKLVISAGIENHATTRHLLESPMNNFDNVVNPIEHTIQLAPEDASRGPHPLEFRILEFVGQHTIRARYVIETWLVESRYPQSALLSNRWTAREDVDEHHNSTITVRGRAIFRGDLLTQFLAGAANDVATLTADQFRQRFLFVPRSGYTREQIHVEVESNGLAVNYSFVDTVYAYVLVGRNRITKITGNASLHVTQTGGGIAGFAAGGIMPGNHAPKTTLIFTVDVWGSVLAKREYLIAVAIGVMFRSGFYSSTASHVGTSLSVDFPNRHAHGQRTLEASGFWGMFNSAQDALPLLQSASQNIPNFPPDQLPAEVPAFQPGLNAQFQIAQILSLNGEGNLSGPISGFLEFKTSFWNFQFNQADIGVDEEAIINSQIVPPAKGSRSTFLCNLVTQAITYPGPISTPPQTIETGLFSASLTNTPRPVNPTWPTPPIEQLPRVV